MTRILMPVTRRKFLKTTAIGAGALAMPAIAVLAIFSIMWRWNEFLWPLIVTNSEQTRPLTVGEQHGERRGRQRRPGHLRGHRGP